MAVVAMGVAACSSGEMPPGAGGGVDGGQSGADAMASGQELECKDGVDNDGDNMTDCADPDCAGFLHCIPETDCANGFDDDVDMRMDCADSDCDGVGACEFGAEATCDDRMDNDGDGIVDCADPDCMGVGSCEAPAETSCADDFDNDGDGMADCADQDCNGVGFCEFATETSCGDGNDNDGDGVMDCADSDCAGLIACVLSCPAGSTLTSLVAADVPLAVPDDNTVVMSTVTLGDVGVVSKTVVELSSDHTFVGDLKIGLESPDGSSRLLIDRVGGGDDFFTGTILADDAPTSISGGTAPYTGAFKPSESLDAFLGLATAGDWKLTAVDVSGGVEGSITAFTLHVCACTNCEVGAQCSNGDDDDGDNLVDCADPDCASAAVCESGGETTCGDEFDNDGDGMIDCLDPDCAGVDSCENGTETICGDGFDNDGDMLADCADQDCDTIGSCEFGTETTCGDTSDNDGDTLVDCADSDCDTIGSCEFGAETTCDDGIDNDGDGVMDCFDTDCNSTTACTPETDCFDGADNDTDGATDCADPGCFTATGCEPLGETSCGDGIDNDGNGTTDCADSACSGLVVCLLSCPAGSSGATYAAADLPQAVSNSIDPAVSQVTVVGAGVITQVAVQIDITHTYDGDLDISLRSPDGTTRVLSSDNGGTAENYVGTVFTDTATELITGGTAPFTGLFQPEESLDAFAGVASAGTWELEVIDDAAGDDGSFTAFALTVCSCTDCEVGASCQDGSDNDGDGKIDCADDDCLGMSFCEPITERTCNDNFDNDGDLLVDCADPNCDTVGICEFGAETSCDDGSDNDGDGLVDCADPDCDGIGTCENPAERTCDDGLDNDNDTLIDCLDNDCNGVGICEFDVETSCGDGNDNDSDGVIDCFDADCAASAACVPETDCLDGMDNDSDGATDCADPGCFEAAGCEFTGETLCSDGIDNDGDGLTDCQEPSCGLACSVASCPAGQTAIGMSGANLPLPFIDNDTVNSVVSTAATGTVTRVAVRFSASHTYDGDLDISLLSPAGTSVDLSSDNGGTDENYTSTVFIDSAATSITAGTAPFTGDFRPEVALSTVDGEAVAGSWTLAAADDAGGDTGSFLAFDLAICVSQP